VWSARGIAERLGRQRRVAGHEGQRRRAGQQRLQLRRAGLVRRTLGQRVLDDPEPSPRVAQPDAQIGRLRHRDAPVVDREHRIGGADLLGDLVYDG
jgi:hypothetical protein